MSTYVHHGAADRHAAVTVECQCVLRAVKPRATVSEWDEGVAYLGASYGTVAQINGRVVARNYSAVLRALASEHIARIALGGLYAPARRRGRSGAA